MRYARKRDDNEAEIVKALRIAGASVTILDAAGVPDLLVGYRGRTLLLEVKQIHAGTAAPNRRAQGGEGELTAAQAKWHGGWCGARAIIVHDVAEALAALHATPGPGAGVFAETGS